MIEEIEGKTVKKVYKIYDDINIRFTDDTIICLWLEENFDGTDYIEIEERQQEELHNEVLAGLGFISEEELKARILRNRMERYEEREAYERETYNRLKAKFEGDKYES